MGDVQRRDLIGSLAGRLPLASHDELRVLDRVLQRLELGRERYGLLDLAKPRDWRRERFEERLDALVYDVAEELALEDRARADLHEVAQVEMLAEWRPDAHETRISEVPARIATQGIDDHEPYEDFDLDLGGAG